MIETTVIIPNLNGMKYLRGCLDSLYVCENAGKGETGRDLQFPIVVVDNGSTDGSADFIAEHYPEITLIRFSENKGFCGAVNAGILAAETPFVILLNNDTTVAKGFVSALMDCAKQNESFFSVSAKLVSMQEPELVDDAGDYYCALGWAFARGKGKPSADFEKNCRIFAACGGAAIYRTEIIKKLGLFDENHFAYLEDIDLGYRAKLSGYQNYFEPKAVVYHAGSATSGSRYNEFKVRLASRNSIYLVWKNMPLLQIAINLPFLILGFGIKYVFFVKKGYGKVYRRGLLEGIKLSLSESGKTHKQVFHMKKIPHYIRIEFELLYNILRKILNL